jgi:predicted nucleotide-binding protein (sugar kinase/HSP70/actin superfamily)
VFVRTFLEELGAEIAESPATNRKILDLGVTNCVDEACLPVKLFHGHVLWLRDKCDLLLLPRVIGLREKEYICPMFCGLVEMVKNDIPGLPRLIDTPLRSAEGAGLERWALHVGKSITDDKRRIRTAFASARDRYRTEKTGFCDNGYRFRVGLIGHAYNLYDRYISMDLKQKLNELGVGVVTSEWLDMASMEAASERLYKRPFWTFAREYFGAAVTLAESGTVDGIIYLSSFSCGIDSVVTELIQSEVGDVPMLVVKLDEHSGEAGLMTRLEAFADMLKRRRSDGCNLSQYGQCRTGCGHAVSGAENSLCPAGAEQ